MIALRSRCPTVGDVLPTIHSPSWYSQFLAARVREEFWRGFWWAAWLFLGIGVWAGWLAAQAQRGP